jgi:hypothetical protein
LCRLVFGEHFVTPGFEFSNGFRSFNALNAFYSFGGIECLSDECELFGGLDITFFAQRTFEGWLDVGSAFRNVSESFFSSRTFRNILFDSGFFKVELEIQELFCDVSLIC